MTRDEWRQLEPVLTQAAVLPEADRNALLETAGVNDALRREIQYILNRCVAPPTTGGVHDTLVRAAAAPHSPAATPALGPGDTLDGRRYVVVRQIGRGGMGSVYLANDTELGTLVALKVVASDERLITEARRAAVCSSHPNVVSIHNVLRTEFNAQPLSVLVMEYVPGTPAKQLLLEGPVDPVRALRWARDVADAIAFAHEQQVLHCDLKPGNVIITHDERAKVLDFGISRPTFDAGSGPLIGTLPYMAPEQLDAGEFTEAGDIYSLGVMLFELVAGRRPFEGDHAALRVQIAMTPPPRLSELVPGVPPALDAAVERALAKKPADRFRSARSFQRALEDVRIAEVQRQAAPVVISAVPLEPRRSIARSLAAATGVVAAAVLGVVALGALTSAAFNIKLGRSDFVSETAWDWFTWGRRTSVPPMVILLASSLVATAARLLWRFSIRVSNSVRLIDQRARNGLREMIRGLHLDDMTVASALAPLLSLVGVGIGVVLAGDLFPALVTFVSNGAETDLALLSPNFVGLHNRYRVVFTFVVIWSVIVWLPILRMAHSWRSIPRIPIAAGMLTILAGLILLHLPYRTLFAEFAGEAFEVAQWRDNICYVLGNRDDETLLLCPDLNPPRHRITKNVDISLVKTGIREDVFSRFGDELSNHINETPNTTASPTREP